MDEYTFLLCVFAFVLGVTVGSFLNVLIFRLRSGVRITGRSKCLSCTKILKPRMLVPLFSFLFQKGRCGYCGVKLSLQYPLVEAVLGFLYVVIIMVHQIDPLAVSLRAALLAALDAIIWTVLLGITVYDLRHKIIPDRFSLIFALLGLLGLLLKWQFGLFPAYYLPLFDTIPRWVDFVAGPALALPFALLWLLSGGRAMGLGDAKLAWGIGWFLGLTHGFSAIIFAFWSAFIPSIILLLLPKKRFTMKSEIPFAPFLVFGTFLVYTFGFDIFAWTF